MEEHTGCTPWMLSTPYSVKLLSSLLWTESFRNTRNCSKPWSTRKGHSFPQRFSGVQRSIIFPHGTQHTQSVRLKAVRQSEFKSWTCILKFHEFQIEQEKSHTHTHTHNTHIHKQKCWYTVCYLGSNFTVPSIELQSWTDEKSLNPRTACCTSSIPTIWTWGFLSRILMHT
jgi:hypothetical protein